MTLYSEVNVKVTEYEQENEFKLKYMRFCFNFKIMFNENASFRKKLTNNEEFLKQ